MRKIILISVLFIAACKPKADYDYIYRDGYNADKQRDIFLECLARTKSSVTSANDDEDTDDTINACSGAASTIAQVWTCVKNCGESDGPIGRSKEQLTQNGRG